MIVLKIIATIFSGMLGISTMVAAFDEKDREIRGASIFATVASFLSIFCMWM